MSFIVDMASVELEGGVAYLFVPESKNSRLPIFFNVHGVVGAQPAENYPEDVTFVQYSLNKWANAFPKDFNNQALQITGIIDATTIKFIHILQTSISDHSAQNIRDYMPKKYSQSPLVSHGDQKGDGRVSPAKKGYNYANQKTWIIVPLNHILQDQYKEIWPRIDKISDCPEALRKMCIREIRGD